MSRQVDPIGDPAQEPLPTWLLRQQALMHLCDQVDVLMGQLGRQTLGSDATSDDRELLTIYLSRELGQRLVDAATERAAQAVRTRRWLSRKKIADALGVSRQRIHQIAYPDGRY